MGRDGDEKGNENGERVRGEESLEIRHSRIEAELKLRHCHSARGIISVDRGGRLQVASSFGYKTRCLFNDVERRREPGLRNGREKAETGTGTETRKRS